MVPVVGIAGTIRRSNPGLTNLAGRHPDVVQRLTAAVIAWHRSMPPDNGPALGEEILRRQKDAAIKQGFDGTVPDPLTA